MTYLIRLENGKPGIVGLPPGVSIDAAAQGQTWIEIDPIPDAPIEALLVDWDAGTVAIDPSYSPPLPPAYGAAWAELIMAPLYQRVMSLSLSIMPVSSTMSSFGIAFQAHQSQLPHEVWASALSASAGNLAAAVNATDAPLTAEEMAWVEDWSERHHLGLVIEWPA